MSEEIKEVESNGEKVAWELISPDGDAANLAKEVGLALESLAKRLGVAREVATDAKEMTGWFVGKKRVRILSELEAIKADTQKELNGISQATINYSTTSYDLAKTMQLALGRVALDGIKDTPASEPVKLSKTATEEIEKISQGIDSFVKSYADVRGKLGGEAEGAAEAKETDAKSAEPKDTETEDSDVVQGEELPPELLGNREQSLEVLKDNLTQVNKEAEDKNVAIDNLLKQVEKFHSKSYLDQKKLNASVTNTVGTLERSLTENKMRHSLLEKNIVDLSSKMSLTLDRMESELKDTIKDLEHSGNQKLSELHGKVDDHKEDYKDKLATINSDYSSLKESLDLHSKNYEELSKGLTNLGDKLSDLEAKHEESSGILQEGIDKLKEELAKAKDSLKADDKHKRGLIFAWGVLITIIAVAALIGTWF
ncbi:MAG: hypothetical protein LBE27_00435 [Deltaproteobacteria bacterium]|jgi:hypothetical protein|nr:hypothetical protein [Deltaproteobacteria bacterium]